MRFQKLSGRRGRAAGGGRRRHRRTVRVARDAAGQAGRRATGLFGLGWIVVGLEHASGVRAGNMPIKKLATRAGMIRMRIRTAGNRG